MTVTIGGPIYPLSIEVLANGARYTCERAPEPGPEPDPARGRVIAYSQRDLRWSKAHMGGTPQTVGGMGCAMLCASMVLSQVAPDVLPGEFNAVLNERGGYNVVGSEAHLAWDRLPSIYPELTWLGRESFMRPLYASEMDRIRGFIAEQPLPIWVDFRPLTSGLDTHFVLAESWDGDDITIIDPWMGDRVGLLARYARTGQDLARAIWGYRRLVVG